jgi:transglutaminase-like putative cysteine protease
MSRTGYTVAAAAVLTVLSLALILTRRHMLGAEINGPRGTSTWRVTLEVAGDLPPDRTALITLPPLDFRQQHVYYERFDSDELSHRVVHTRTSGRREVVWQRRNTTGAQQFRLAYSFDCALGLWPPTPGMERMTEALDASPVDSAPGKHAPMARRTFLRPGYRMQSEHKDVQHLARGLARPDTMPADQARALFDFVRKLEAKEAPPTQSALECLRARGGGSGGKARLLVALCRSRRIPARLVAGLVLDGDGQRGLHFWAEAWLNNYWLPMDPARGHFGGRALPRNYLVLNLGEEEIVRGRESTFRPAFTVEKLEAAAGDDGAPARAADGFWKKLSLYRLRPAEQQLVRFLLLLPLAALIVSVFRTVIGVPTFGTFAPALMGMAFLDLKVLPWGMLIFLVVVLAGWGLRRLLDRLHLLQVPRVGILLTLLVLLIVTGIAVGAHLGLPATSYFGLLPLVILTHLVERFWTVETEDGTAASFKTLAGTFVVAVTVSLALSPRPVGTWMFRYPETTGVILACQLLLGRYTGYRLSELYRFQDLIVESHPGGGGDELAGSVAEAPPGGYPGNEPAQRGVHPGPEPAAPVPAGGRQAADARAVPADRRTHA